MQPPANSSLAGNLFLGDAVSTNVSMQKSTADSHQKLLVGIFPLIKHAVPHLASSLGGDLGR